MALKLFHGTQDPTRRMGVCAFELSAVTLQNEKREGLGMCVQRQQQCFCYRN